MLFSDRTRTIPVLVTNEGMRGTSISIPAYCTWTTNTHSIMCVNDQARYKDTMALLTSSL